jgi:hypothetical protein
MRRLKHRVQHVGTAHKRAMAGYTPVPTDGSAQVTGGSASPAGADVMPLAMVTVYPAPGGYQTLAYQGLAPIFTADGAAVPATSPGRWAQLRAAGRP